MYYDGCELIRIGAWHISLTVLSSYAINSFHYPFTILLVNTPQDSPWRTSKPVSPRTYYSGELSVTFKKFTAEIISEACARCIAVLACGFPWLDLSLGLGHVLDTYAYISTSFSHLHRHHHHHHSSLFPHRIPHC